MGETPAEQSPRAVQMDVGQPSCHVPDLCPQETLMYFSPRTLDTAGSYHLSCDLQNLLSKQESDLTRDRPDLSLGRLPWWFSSKESACQCRRHKFAHQQPPILPLLGQAGARDRALPASLHRPLPPTPSPHLFLGLPSSASPVSVSPSSALPTSAHIPQFSPPPSMASQSLNSRKR